MLGGWFTLIGDLYGVFSASAGEVPLHYTAGGSVNKTVLQEVREAFFDARAGSPAHGVLAPRHTHYIRSLAGERSR